MNLEILKKANFPKSYSTIEEAMQYGSGTNIFILPDNSVLCLSSYSPLFQELLDAGIKTMILED